MEHSSSSAVVAGQFNPAIVTPHWVVQQGILPDGTFESTGTAGLAGGVSPFTHKGAGIQWQAAMDKLSVVVATASEVSRSAEFAAEVVGLLSHTPLTAVGNNYEFVLDGVLAVGICTMSASAVAGAVGGAIGSAEARLVIPLKEEGLELRLRVQAVGPRVALGFNFHRIVSSTDGAQQALARALSDFDTARSLCQKLEGGS